MRFAYTILYVPDVAAAVTFYEDAFRLTRRFVHESGTYAEMETGETALAFASETEVAIGNGFRTNRAEEAPAGVEVAFVSDDVRAAFDHACAVGAVPFIEPNQKPWGQTVSYVRDLNGILVEICSEVAG